MVISFHESNLKPEVYSYLIAMTAVVKELNEFSKALRKLKGFARNGVISHLDKQNVELIEKYQSNLIDDGVRIANWVLHQQQEDGQRISSNTQHLHGTVHERLLAMYICAGRGLEAERQLWEMKIVGKEADADLHDIVLAICASQKEGNAIQRVMAGLEVTNRLRKKTMVWLLRGYVKGGHFEEAAETLTKMLDMSFCPEYLDRAAVLQGLRNRIQQQQQQQQAGGGHAAKYYMTLCKRLYNANLIGPCLVYMYINKYRLWVVRML